MEELEEKEFEETSLINIKEELEDFDVPSEETTNWTGECGINLQKEMEDNKYPMIKVEDDESWMKQKVDTSRTKQEADTSLIKQKDDNLMKEVQSVIITEPEESGDIWMNSVHLECAKDRVKEEKETEDDEDGATNGESIDVIIKVKPEDAIMSEDERKEEIHGSGRKNKGTVQQNVTKRAKTLICDDKVFNKSTPHSTSFECLIREKYSCHSLQSATTIPEGEKSVRDINEGYSTLVGGDVFKCELCQFTLKTEDKLKHKCIHISVRPFNCQICNLSFKHLTSLQSHEDIHSQERQFQCSLCPKNFSSETELKNPKRKHPQGKCFTCFVCGKSFAMKASLEQHHATLHTGEKPYVCQFCNMPFVRWNTMKQHVKIVHPNEEPFKCSVCGEIFDGKSKLMKHEKVHNVKVKGKLFTCKICEKTFDRFSRYQCHEMVHRDERPFKCDKCEKSFKLKRHLTRHMMIHSGVRPFTCQYCDRTFNRSGVMKTHERLHTGEKPFKCQDCGGAFKRKSCLKTHIKRRHKQNDTDENKQD